jgi:hypothetical protein
VKQVPDVSLRLALAATLAASSACTETAVRVLGSIDARPAAGDAISSGLVAHFRLDELAADDVVTDAIGGHDGTPVNGPTPSAITAPLQFPNLRSRHFDGRRLQAVTLGGDLPRNDEPQSITLWFRYLARDVGAASQDLVGLGDATTSAIQIGLRWETDRPDVFFAVWQRLGRHVCTAPLPAPDAWHHVAYTFDGTRHALYLDGDLVDASTVEPQRGAASVARLGTSPGAGEPFTGWLDDVRIYARALTPGEVTRLAAGQP